MKTRWLFLFALVVAWSLTIAGSVVARGPVAQFERHVELGPTGLHAVPTGFLVTIKGQIGGAATAVAVRGQYAYVACGPRLVVLNISNPAAPRVVGQSAPLPGIAQGIALTQRHAYVAAGEGGVWIVDISDPMHPSLAGLYSAPWVARNVAIAGDYAYVTAYVYTGTPPPRGGLQILSVSDPAHPVEIAWYGAGQSFYDGIAVAGHYAFYSAGSLHVLDVADPAHPTRVGGYNPSMASGSLQVLGNYAYMAVASGLCVVNITEPANPTLAGSFNVPGFGSGQYFCRVAVAGRYAYLGDQEERLYIVDVSNPAQPTQAGFYATPGYTHGLAAAGEYLYLAKDRAIYSDAHWLGGSLHIVRVANPAQPSEVGVYRAWGSAEGLNLSGGCAYVADRDGVHIINVADPARPAESSFYDSPGSTQHASVAGNILCSADGSQGLHTLDVSDRTHPRVLGSFATSGSAERVVQAGNYAYLLDYNAGLRILDLSDPAHPSQVGFVGLQSAYDLTVTGHLAYVSCQYNLYAVDVADPAHSSVVGVCQHYGDGRHLAISGDYAYVAQGYQPGIAVICISDPTHPTLAYSYNPATGPSFHGIAVVGRRAYVGMWDGLRVLDFSRINRPVDLGMYSLPDLAYDVVLDGNSIYVATGLGGLFVLEYLPYHVRLPVIMRGQR